jgi:uncharacterized protein
VHDLASVIRPEHEQAMEAAHTALQRETGVAIVVITVPRLDGEPIEDFTVRVGHEWGVGTRGQDRGMVLALAVQERRIYLATGYGVEGFLPDGRVGRILDEYALPALRRGDFSEGLFRTSQALVGLSRQELGTGARRSPLRDPALERRGKVLAAFVALVAFVVMAYLAVRHPRLFMLILLSMAQSGGGRGGRRRGGFGSRGGFGGFGGGGFGGGGAGRRF